MSVLTDVSFDYAVVAQAKGPRAGALDEAFALKMGLDLAGGIARFDRARAVRQAEGFASLQSEIQAVQGHVETLHATIVPLPGEVEGLHRSFADEVKAVQNRVETLHANIVPLTGEVEVLHQAFRGEVEALHRALGDLGDRLDRSPLERLLFRRSGRPIRPLRRVLFHVSGKPRGVFRRWVLDEQRKPRRAFRRWMSSPEYQMLRWPMSQRPTIVPQPQNKCLTPPGDAPVHPLRSKLLARLEATASAKSRKAS